MQSQNGCLVSQVSQYPMIDRLPNESNWDYCMRRARDINKDELIKSLLRQIQSMAKKRRDRFPLWSYVGEATNHGCGISSAIVEVYLGEEGRGQ